jgi:wobble nucleotide-excising tRNase
MSLQQIKVINSVGRFRSVSASGDVTFKKFTLIFGENGRGKTTLCAILRSLQTNTPDIIAGRKTLSSANKPMVRIAMSSGTAAFADGVWKAPNTRIRIFDAQYIADNIYSGDAIGTDQRRNLCRVMLGQAGVDLARKYDECDNGINIKNADIRNARAPLTQHVSVSQIGDFIELEADPEIDAKIAAKTREVAGLKESDKLRNRAALDEIELPPCRRIWRGCLKAHWRMFPAGLKTP